jgi:hypothetical protein
MDGEVVRRYVNARRELLRGEGLDPDVLEKNATDGAAGTSTLVRFFCGLHGRGT